MRNPQRFEGLEEDKITWFSTKNDTIQSKTWGLEGCEIAGFSNLLLRCKDKEIAGHSNIYWLIVTAAKGLAEDKITWFSNFFIVIPALKKGKIAWFSNKPVDKLRPMELWKKSKITWYSNTDVAGVAQSSALEKSKLHGTQTLRCARAIGRKV